MSELQCLDEDEDCLGKIEYRYPLSASGKSFVRCEYHWQLRLMKQEEWDRELPDSPNAPDWFDPMDAGEYWDSDY